MRKISYKASSDVALVKYWGKKDEELRLPENGSVSMILQGLDTVTTIAFEQELIRDSVTINGESEEGEEQRVVKHLDRIRDMAHAHMFAKVVSENSFPRGTGLSSSGSGFAALTYAATSALGLGLTEREMSILARQGSGTACRCVCGGFVEWKDGDTSETSYAESLFGADHWDIVDLVAVVDDGKKLVSSTQGHALAQTSLFYQTRQEHMQDKVREVKEALRRKDFTALGELVEAEALEFHSILLTSQPPMIAWYPGTVEVMLAVQAMRREGIEAYFTINTGFNVHVLTLPDTLDQVRKRLEQLSLVKKTLTAQIGNKPQEVQEHLF
jgi:diphosphomevalonate decarboxylase